MESLIIEKYEVPSENMNAEFNSKVQTPYDFVDNLPHFSVDLRVCQLLVLL